MSDFININSWQGLQREIAELCDIGGEKGFLDLHDGIDEYSIFTQAKKEIEEKGECTINGDTYVLLMDKLAKIPKEVLKLLKPQPEVADAVAVKKPLIPEKIKMENTTFVNIEGVSTQGAKIEGLKEEGLKKEEPKTEFDTWAQKKWWDKNWHNTNVQKNFKKYRPLFKKASELYNVPESILMAMCAKESTMGVGSDNIMQMIKSTGDTYCHHNPTNPKLCILGAAKYLSELLKAANGNMYKALVGYNCGNINSKNAQSREHASKVIALSKLFEKNVLQ